MFLGSLKLYQIMCCAISLDFAIALEFFLRFCCVVSLDFAISLELFLNFLSNMSGLCNQFGLLLKCSSSNQFGD